MKRNLTGERFGRLVVKREAMGVWYAGSTRPRLHRRWSCVCDCGAATTVGQIGLVTGATTSCGCRRREALAAHEPPHPTGERNPTWMGDDIGYGGMHDRLRRSLGRASEHSCVQCGDRAHDWAYRWDLQCSGERLSSRGGGASRPYCTHECHYQPMCKQCHTTFDLSDERRAA